MAIASANASRNSLIDLVTTWAWSEIRPSSNSDRQILLDALQCSLNRGANFGDVGAGRHGGAEQHRLPALVVRLGGRRVLEAPSELGDVAEPEGLLPGAKPQLANVLERSEPTLYIDADRPLPCLDSPCRIHRILAAERSLDVERGEPALGQCRRRHFDEDALILCSQEIDFCDAGNAEQNVACGFREGLKLRIREALTCYGVERNVGIAELVIEEGTDHTVGQRLTNVADFLARLIERLLDGIPPHRALQINEDVGETGSRVGADEVEARRLLQLALDLVDDLVLHLLDRRAGPEHLHDHHAKRKVGILLLARCAGRKRHQPPAAAPREKL